MIEIRDEQPGDATAVWDVNRQAFGQDQEARIVDALRDNSAVTVSLVAVDDGRVVGHIMFSPLSVNGLIGAGLGPMAVIPSQQRNGIGSQLVKAGLKRLRDNGCPFVVVIGHPHFYPRFGFQPAAAYGLTCQWDVAAEAFLVNVLDPAVTAQLHGRVEYRAEFSTIE